METQKETNYRSQRRERITEGTVWKNIIYSGYRNWNKRCLVGLTEQERAALITISTVLKGKGRKRKKDAKRRARLLGITLKEYKEDIAGNIERLKAIRAEKKLQSMTGSNPLTNGISSEIQERKLDDDDETSQPSKMTRIETTANGVSKTSLVCAFIHLQHQWIFIGLFNCNQ